MKSELRWRRETFALECVTRLQVQVERNSDSSHVTGAESEVAVSFEVESAAAALASTLQVFGLNLVHDVTGTYHCHHTVTNRSPPHQVYLVARLQKILTQVSPAPRECRTQHM